MSFLGNLANAAQKKIGQVYNSASGLHPVQTSSPQVQQALAHPTYVQRGLQTPMQRQQFAQSLVRPVPQFNPIKQIAPQLSQARHDVGLGIGLAGTRVLGGIAQDAAGLYDLATPGLGTSRVSKGLENFNKNVDATARANGVTGVYRGAQLPLSAATFLTPGAVVKGAAMVPKVANIAEKVAPAVRILNAPTTKLAEKLATKGAAGRITAAGVKGLNANGLVNAAAGTAAQLGLMSGKGQDINRTNALQAAGMNLAGSVLLPAGAQAAGELGKAAAPAAKATAKAATKTHKSGANKERINANISAEQTQLNREHKGLLRQLQNTPVENTIANNNIQAKIDRNRFQHSVLESKKQKLSIPERLMNQQVGNTIGGPNALQYMHAKKNGLVFDGVDGKPRFEIDDSGAKLTGKIPEASYMPGKLGEILDHSELYKQYPELKNTKVRRRDGWGDNASYDPRDNSITVSDTPKKKVLLHEVQHAIQKREDFARGGTPDGTLDDAAFEKYRRIAGEAEARAVEARADMPMSERYVGEEGNDPLASLKQEALKYKSADEYKRAISKQIESNNSEGLINHADAINNGRFSLENVPISQVSQKKVELVPRNGKVTEVPYTPSSERVDAYAKRLLNGEKNYPTLLVDKNYNVIGGGHRLAALQKAGETNVRVARVGSDSNLTDLYNQAHAEAKSSLSGSDLAATKREIAELDRKIHAFGSDNSPAKQALIDRRDRRMAEVGGSTAPNKEAQLEAIKRLNPMTDEYHTGIRSVDDIKTFKEAYNDPESFAYPDYSKEQAAQALKDGKVTVYSSYPLDSNKAQFVSPSKMAAQDYAGNGKVHSKVVSLDEVAWINGDEGNLVGKSAPAPRSTFYDSLDVPKKDLIIKHDGGTAMSIDKKPTAAPSTTPKKPLPSVAKVTPEKPASKLSQAESGVSLPKNTPKNQRGFVTSVKNSPQVSAETRKATKGVYAQRNTQKLADNADKVANTDLTKATTKVQESLDKKLGTINDKDVATSIAVAKKHDAAGNVQQSTDIYEKLAKHLTKQGQSIQAASLLSNQTPEGLRYGAQKALRKSGVELTPELQTKLTSAIDEVKGAKTKVERDYAVKKVQKVVSDNTPTSVSDKLSSIWKAGLLTGIKTQTGNFLSNGTFGVLHAASNPLAVSIDKAISVITKERTKSLTGRGLFSGTGEGIKKGGTYIKSGIDERKAIDNKYDTHGEVNFKNKALNTYVNGVFRLMGAADRPAYYSQLRNSLYDLALTDARNKGVKSADVAAHVKEFTANPPDSAFQVATNEAEKAVLANDTALSNMISGARQGIDRIDNKLARGTASTALNVLAPFTKVPSAFLGRVVDFSPVGAVKTAAEQIANKKLDQRTLATALSEATTGTALMYLGYKAASNNMLSGNYPNDQKEAQRWKADGIQPNSIKVGDKWLSLNYFGPLGLLFNAGQRVNDAAKQGENAAGRAIAAAAGAPKDLMGQSFLQGLSGFSNAINDPTRSAKTYVNSQAGSIIPTIVGDVANATDKMQRQANTVGQTLQSKIPGARQSLPAKQDVYGNKLSAKTSGTSTLLNPFRPSTDLSKGNSVLTEVNRLHKVDPNNTDLQVTPTPVDKVITVDKSKVNLTDKQRYDLQAAVGKNTQTFWGKLIKTPEYQKLDDIEKARALSNLRTDSTTLATRQYVVDNNLGTYSTSPSKRVIALGNGTADISLYATNHGNPIPVKKATGRTTRTSTGRVATARKSTGGTGRSKKQGTYKSNLGSAIKSAQASNNKARSYTLAKQNISSKLKGNSTHNQKYSMKKITLNKKA